MNYPMDCDANPASERRNPCRPSAEKRQRIDQLGCIGLSCDIVMTNAVLWTISTGWFNYAAASERHAYAYVRTYLRTYVRTYIYYVRAYTYTYVITYVHRFVCTNTYTYVRILDYARTYVHDNDPAQLAQRLQHTGIPHPYYLFTYVWTCLIVYRR